LHNLCFLVLLILSHKPNREDSVYPIVTAFAKCPETLRVSVHLAHCYRANRVGKTPSTLLVVTAFAKCPETLRVSVHLAHCYRVQSKRSGLCRSHIKAYILLSYDSHSLYRCSIIIVCCYDSLSCCCCVNYGSVSAVDSHMTYIASV